MYRRVLITGGAGFIGSHLCDALLERGYAVRVLDSLCPQVHGNDCARPSYLAPAVDLLIGDVRDPASVNRALDGVDAVFHFAARVGVGQSMYSIEEYVDVNVRGTATLLEALVKRNLKKLVVASSMSVYGEGLYQDASGARVTAPARSLEQLRRADWEPRGADGLALTPVPTPETKAVSLESVYALTKYDQERLCLIAARAYGISATALRLFNVYGPRQALSNPYTGVLAIFANRLLNDSSPLLFEDGKQRRDFVSVYDVARACVKALTTSNIDGEVFNVGSGRSLSINNVALLMAKALGKTQQPEITGKHRAGDIRHCFADVTRAKQKLDFSARVDFSDGVLELARSLAGQRAHDRVLEARAELDARGLTL